MDSRTPSPPRHELEARVDETLLSDGRWRAVDGRVIDPKMGDGRRLWVNTAFLFGLPAVVAVALPWYVWTHGLGWSEVLASVALYWATGLAITAGYHRLFSHRGYRAAWPVRLLAAFFGAMAAQNSVFTWAAAHRYHHNEVDTIGDPYNAKRGFWFSHFLWVLRNGAHSDDHDNIPDLLEDPILRFQHDHYLLVATGGNVAAVGLLGWWTGEWVGMFIIAGLLRVLAVQHSTFFINSWAHMWGEQPWNKGNTARDNWFLSLLSFGEGYHNYHHAFMHDYRNGVRWYHWDPSKWLIWSLEKIGLASDLKRTPDDILLRARYAEGKSRLEARLKTIGESIDDWNHRVVVRREEVQVAVRGAMEAAQARLSDLQERRDAMLGALESSLQARTDTVAQELNAAGERLDAALDELQAQRRAWASLRRRALAEAGEELQAELRDLRRAMREAKRAARAALAEWERLLAAFIAEPLPAPA